jgi:hypothetical protein
MASIGLKEHIGEALGILDIILAEAIKSLKAERDLWGQETPNPQ